MSKSNLLVFSHNLKQLLSFNCTKQNSLEQSLAINFYFTYSIQAVSNFCQCYFQNVSQIHPFLAHTHCHSSSLSHFPYLIWIITKASASALVSLQFLLIQQQSEKVKVAQSCLTLWDPHGLYSSWSSPGQNIGVGGLSLLQGIFPTQGLNQVSHTVGRFFTS